MNSCPTSRHFNPVGQEKLRRNRCARRQDPAQGKGRRTAGSAAQFGPQAELQLRAEFGDRHSVHDQEFATEHLAWLVVIGQLALDAAILAILVPAEAAIGNGFRTDVLEARSEERRVGKECRL